MKCCFLTVLMMGLITACGQNSSTGSGMHSKGTLNATAAIPKASNLYLEDGIGHTIDSVYKDWTKTFTGFDVQKFKRADTMPFENTGEIAHNSLQRFYAIYKPILFYSPDERLFLDIYSDQLNLEKHKGVYTAAVEIDATIQLYDVANKTSKRILFLGSTAWIEDVYWLDDTRFVLLGVSMREDADIELYSPKIYIGNISTHSFEVFESVDERCARRPEARYQSALLQQLHIKNL